MRFEVVTRLQNGYTDSFITKEYDEYAPEKKMVNGLYQIGFVKDGKTRKTWIPYANGKYGHNVDEIIIKEASTGRRIESIKASH